MGYGPISQFGGTNTLAQTLLPLYPIDACPNNAPQAKLCGAVSEHW